MSKRNLYRRHLAGSLLPCAEATLERNRRVRSAAGRAKREVRATTGSESADARRPQAALAEGPAANRCPV